MFNKETMVNEAKLRKVFFELNIASTFFSKFFSFFLINLGKEFSNQMNKSIL